MKILIATGLYPPEIGGPATYTKMLEEELPQHDIELTVAPYGWVRRYPKILRHIAYTWKLIRESKNADLIYALDPVSVGLPACLACFILRKPFILRIAGDYAWEQGQQRFGVTAGLDDFVSMEKQHPIVWLMAKVEKGVAKRAVRIIVPSNYMKGIVHAWGISEINLIVIYSALFPISVGESRDAIRGMFNYDGIVLMTAGRLVPWKGVGTLISVMKELETKLGKVTLVVAGDGPLLPDLKKQAVRLGVEEQVRFVGRLPKDALGAAVKGADVFVLNTAYEGLSHQLLEVMDLGVPIVTTNVGGNPELIQDGVTGLLVPFDDRPALIDAIVRMGTHENLRRRIVEHARLRVKDFDKRKVVAELVDVLRNVV